MSFSISRYHSSDFETPGRHQLTYIQAVVLRRRRSAFVLVQRNKNLISALKTGLDNHFLLYECCCENNYCSIYFFCVIVFTFGTVLDHDTLFNVKLKFYFFLIFLQEKLLTSIVENPIRDKN